MVDTWDHKLHYRPDWDIGGHRLASLPVQLTREKAKGYLACQYYGGVMGMLRGVLGGADLVMNGTGSGHVQLRGAVGKMKDVRASVGVEESLSLP